MEDVTSKDSLELEVSNFGPIVKAKVDLRPLTVFVGPSNTGKSYLAILIYALHKYFSPLLGASTFSAIDQDKINALDKLFEQISAEVENTEETSVKQTLGLLSAQASIVADGPPFKSKIDLPPPITEAIRTVFDEQGDQLGYGIRRCFGMSDTNMLIRKGARDDAWVALRKQESNGASTFEYKLAFGKRRTELIANIPAELPIHINREFVARFPASEPSTTNPFSSTEMPWNNPYELVNKWSTLGDFPARQRMKVILDFALPQLAGPFHRHAFYLPADRTGVMHAHSVVVSAMIGSAPMTGIHPSRNTPMVSGVLADFLQQLIELDRPSLQRLFKKPESRDLGAPIEEAILDGSVRIEKSESIGYPHFTYQPRDWKYPLPLMNASSMVSELAPVVLYLRYLVGPDSVLIIEEPESHLHPAMQVEFTRQLAALVQAGVRVIITTHSEWVLEELANIVRRSELPASRRKRMPHGEFALRPEQVGAWLFKKKRRPRGSVVSEIRLDDSGLFPSEFDEVARTLHNDWADISCRIGEAE